MPPARFAPGLQLCVVYARGAEAVTHYVSWQTAASRPIESDGPLRIGAAAIGNWDIAAHRNNTPIRFLSGRMDEFMLFSRALSDQEVERLYDQGRPPA